MGGRTTPKVPRIKTMVPNRAMIRLTWVVPLNPEKQHEGTQPCVTSRELPGGEGSVGIPGTVQGDWIARGRSWVLLRPHQIDWS